MFVIAFVVTFIIMMQFPDVMANLILMAATTDPMEYLFGVIIGVAIVTPYLIHVYKDCRRTLKKMKEKRERA